VSRRSRWIIGIIGVCAAAAIAWAIIAAIMPAWYARLIYPLNNISTLQASARRERLDPALIAAVIQVESKWDPGAVSRADAVGLMQLEPETARFIASHPTAPPGSPTQLQDPDVSINYGAWYLRFLIDQTGSVPAALVAYNAGLENLSAWRRRAAADGRTFRIPQDVPYPETRAFVHNVLNDAAIYRRAYPDELHPRIPGYAVTTTSAG
jgi:soluble lytic murein transglycosylase